MKKYTHSDIGKFVLRLSLGLLMMLHGIAKVKSGVSFIAGMLASVNLPELMAYGIYAGQILAPIMLIVGFRAKVANVLMIITMLFAIGLAHLGDIFKLSPYGGWAIELQFFYLIIPVVLLLIGTGKIAISTKNKWD